MIVDLLLDQTFLDIRNARTEIIIFKILKLEPDVKLSILSWDLKG